MRLFTLLDILAGCGKQVRKIWDFPQFSSVVVRIQGTKNTSLQKVIKVSGLEAKIFLVETAKCKLSSICEFFIEKSLSLGNLAKYLPQYVYTVIFASSR